MNNAKMLFDKLVSINNPEELLEYCSQNLGSVERIHVDFKVKHDRRHPKLDKDDKKNLAKAVSGFANSGGGVLIWGLEDETLKPKPIDNVSMFVQKLLELAPQVTDPVVGDIDGVAILTNPKTQEGLGILLIPESQLPPHRVILNIEKIKNHYFFRSGNSFIVASHTMLEDMFGRRPKPDLALTVRFSRFGGGQFSVILGIKNRGRGVAKSPFLAIEIQEPYRISHYGVDGNGQFGLPKLPGISNARYQQYGSSQTTVIHSGVTLDITTIKVDLDMSKLESLPNLEIKYQIASEGIHLIENQKVVEISEILSEFNL